MSIIILRNCLLIIFINCIIPVDLIVNYGLPQEWNNDGTYGPERYIEAHIWSDETIDKYRL